MMALISNGVVVWITTATQAALYPSASGLTFVPIPSGVTVLAGYAYNAQTQTFSAPAVTTSPPPPPAPPVSLTPLEFVNLVQSAGGMTDAQLVASKNDPNLAALWIKLGLATQIYSTGPLTAAGLAALQASPGNYLTAAGAAAVIAQWPTTPQAD
jgi:hypothetical protein